MPHVTSMHFRFILELDQWTRMECNRPGFRKKLKDECRNNLEVRASVTMVHKNSTIRVFILGMQVSSEAPFVQLP